ncbi:hypothetical protein [Fibrobacter sp.]|uniref:hypothetical protein n=1 Tax=Fibrobacter sp. TaxID=35828 RepID=UPI00388EB23E
MVNNFKHMIESASLRKQTFDYSVKNLKNDLEQDIRKESIVCNTKTDNELVRAGLSRTGWLRGSLSYPWILVCIVIPAVLDVLM